jgi:cyclic pyranopterin phosphate synthase
MQTKNFTHVNAANQPTMVDVGAKPPTRRVARAHCRVVLGEELLSRVQAGEMPSHKGPVIHTAILAGIMGAKRTSELIPLCHPLGLDDCSVTIEPDGPDALRVVCTAVVTGRTGVEMEALTGATVAALTIYDMCKAFSHDIAIDNVQLIEKTGGKRDFHRAENS